MRPLVFIPNHQDGGNGIPDTASVPLYASYLRQLDLMSIPRSSWADIRWSTDPSSYGKPVAFDLRNSAWERTAKAAALAATCDPAETSPPDSGGGSIGWLAAAIVFAAGASALARRRRLNASRK